MKIKFTCLLFIIFIIPIYPQNCDSLCAVLVNKVHDSLLVKIDSCEFQMNKWKSYFEKYNCKLDSSKMICSIPLPMDSLLEDLKYKVINDSILEIGSHTLNSIELLRKTEHKEGIGIKWEKTIKADIQILPNPLSDNESLIYLTNIKIFKKRKKGDKEPVDIKDDNGIHKNEFVNILLTYYYGRQ